MFSFVDYAKEIWTVGKVNNVDIGVAYDMFRADVAAGQARTYNTGEALPLFDFAQAKQGWESLTDDEQNEAKLEWKVFVKTNYAKICTEFKD